MKRGPKPKGKVKIDWSPSFAYAIGLITADGCLSKDGRHIDLTSKDKAQIILFKKCLGLDTKVSSKSSGHGHRAYHTQFGDVLFYKFLLEIGLTPAKSKTLSKVLVPDAYFMDFFRGYFDGDGSSFSYDDPVWKNSYRFYLSFTSASPVFVDWLRKKMEDLLCVKGHIGYNRNNPYVQLKYAKREAVIICKSMYYAGAVLCLRRKFVKIQRSLRIIEQSRSGETGRRAAFRAQ